MPEPRFPIYIVSKGRWESRLTSRALEDMGVDYRIVVEEQERDEYAKVIDPARVLVLDPRFQDEYDTCDDLGRTKSIGPGAARNFAWQHSIEEGHDWHWVMDDNIRAFYRLAYAKRLYLRTGTGIWAMEHFALRFDNVAMAGPQYLMFVPESSRIPPFKTNTRIYSCNLIRNDLPYRWRGRYNEDTDLSLRMLKDGWCTILYHAFLAEKKWTKNPIGKGPGYRAEEGGNTAEFYATEGTLPKSQMLVDMHPDVTKLVWKFGRAHHKCDYSRFRQPLHLAPGVEVPTGSDEFGMKLVQERPIKSPHIQHIFDTANESA